jgi:DNA-binding Xre family transcriptional regulator
MTTIEYRWLLRERMAERGLFKTTEIIPLLAERGISLSATQAYRLVTATPERLSLPVLAALCDALECSPNDFIAVAAAPAAATRRRAAGERLGDIVALRTTGRPRRARVDPDQP